MSLGYYLVIIGAVTAFVVRIGQRAQGIRLVPFTPRIQTFALGDASLPEAFTRAVQAQFSVIEEIGLKYLTCQSIEIVPGRFTVFNAVFAHPTRADYSLLICGGRSVEAGQTPRFAGIDFTTDFVDGHRLTTSNTQMGPAMICGATWSIYWFTEIGDPRVLWQLHEQLCTIRSAPRARITHNRDMEAWTMDAHRKAFEESVAKGTWRRVDGGQMYSPSLVEALKIVIKSLPGVVHIRRFCARRSMRERAAQLLAASRFPQTGI